MNTARVIVAVIVLAGIAMIASSAGHAQARAPHLCAYKSGQVLMVVAAKQEYCMLFNRSFKGQRVYTIVGKMRCAFFMNAIPSIIISYFSRDRVMGALFCNLLEGRVERTWTRIK